MMSARSFSSDAFLRSSALFRTHLVFHRGVVQRVELPAEFVQPIIDVVHLSTQALVCPKVCIKLSLVFMALSIRRYLWVCAGGGGRIGVRNRDLCTLLRFLYGSIIPHKCQWLSQGLSVCGVWASHSSLKDIPSSQSRLIPSYIQGLFSWTTLTSCFGPLAQFLSLCRTTTHLKWHASED